MQSKHRNTIFNLSGRILVVQRKLKAKIFSNLRTILNYEQGGANYSNALNCPEECENHLLSQISILMNSNGPLLF